MSQSSSKLNKNKEIIVGRGSPLWVPNILIYPFWVCPTSRPYLACPWAVSEASHIINHVSASHISQGSQNMTTVQLPALQEKLVYSLLDIKGAGLLTSGSPAAAHLAIRWHHETGGSGELLLLCWRSGCGQCCE